jgi:hypothetical protein
LVVTVGVPSVPQVGGAQATLFATSVQVTVRVLPGSFPLAEMVIAAPPVNAESSFSLNGIDRGVACAVELIKISVVTY